MPLNTDTIVSVQRVTHQFGRQQLTGIRYQDDDGHAIELYCDPSHPEKPLFLKNFTISDAAAQRAVDAVNVFGKPLNEKVRYYEGDIEKYRLSHSMFMGVTSALAR